MLRDRGHLGTPGRACNRHNASKIVSYGSRIGSFNDFFGAAGF